MKPKTTKKVRIENVGGVKTVELELASPGINVLVGANGAGKSSTLNAVSRAYGAEVALEPRDGADHGTVDVDGVHLVVKKVVRSTGRAVLELASTSHLADLVDGGGHKDPDARARCRNRALLALSRVPVTEEAVAVLAGDPEIAEAALHRIREDLVDDVLTAAELTRRTAHAIARQREEDRDAAAGRAQAHEHTAAEAMQALGGKANLSPVTLAEAEAAERALVAKVEAARLGARQRRQLEQQQAEIRASLGEQAPDPAKFDDAIALRRAAIAEHEALLEQLGAELRALEGRIADARGELAMQREGLIQSERAAKAERERAAAHTHQLQVLEQPVTGPTADDVLALEVELAGAREATERARRSAEHARALAASDEAAAESKRHAERAEIVRALAVTVQDRMGRLLAGTAAEGLTIEGGRLHVIGEGGELLDFETRQSDGQRIYRAFKVAAVAYRDRVVPLDGRLWTQLDPDRKLEVAKIAAELGLTVVTEEPTDGELGIRHLTGDEPAREVA